VDVLAQLLPSFQVLVVCPVNLVESMNHSIAEIVLYILSLLLTPLLLAAKPLKFCDHFCLSVIVKFWPFIEEREDGVIIFSSRLPNMCAHEYGTMNYLDSIHLLQWVQWMPCSSWLG